MVSGRTYCEVGGEVGHTEHHKITLEVAIEMRRAAKQGMPFEKIAEMCNISLSHTRGILYGYSWHRADPFEEPLTPNRSRPQNKNHPKSKLTEEQVREIRQRWANGETQRTLGKNSMSAMSSFITPLAVKRIDT